MLDGLIIMIGVDFMHYAKYTQTGLANLIAHYERKNNDTREYENKNIDKDKTHLNYDLAKDPEDDRTGYQKHKDRLAEVYHLPRADVNTMFDIVITLPKDYDGDPKTFFENCKEFFDLLYGKDNCVGAWVHMDEKSPHMHYASIPVIPNKDYGVEGKKSKDYQYRVNAKKVICKKELQRVHPDLQKFLRAKEPNRTINIINGEVARNGQNISVKELKQKEQLKQLEQKEKEITAKETALEKQSQTLEQAKENITAREKELSSQSAQLDKDLEEMRSFKYRTPPQEEKKGLFGGKKPVPYDEYKKTYDDLQKAISALDRATSENKRLKRQADKPSLLKQELQAERALREQAEDRARQAEDRLQAKESDRDVARSQAFYDVLERVGVKDWQEQQRLKKMFDKSEQEHFKQNRERELAHQHAHTHERETYPER